MKQLFIILAALGLYLATPQTATAQTFDSNDTYNLLEDSEYTESHGKKKSCLHKWKKKWEHKWKKCDKHKHKEHKWKKCRHKWQSKYDHCKHKCKKKYDRKRQRCKKMKGKSQTACRQKHRRWYRKCIGVPKVNILAQ